MHGPHGDDRATVPTGSRVHGRAGAGADPLQQDRRGEAARHERPRAALPDQEAGDRIAGADVTRIGQGSAPIPPAAAHRIRRHVIGGRGTGYPADRALPGTASRAASHRVAPRSAARQSPPCVAVHARRACGAPRHRRLARSSAKVLAAIRCFVGLPEPPRFRPLLLYDKLPQSANLDL